MRNLRAEGYVTKLGQRKKSALREWIESIIIAFILAVIIRTFVIQAFKIPSGSMRPTLTEGDIILVNKFLYGAKIPFTDLRLPKITDPHRGDCIVFIYPKNPKKDFIKRLVGLPGEVVEIRKGTIYINGKPILKLPFSQVYYQNKGDLGQQGQAVKIPDDHYFVLGDNSVNSEDSRVWGFVPKNNILGKAILIYWPLARIRIIK
jgi:signal peptidase I